MSPEFPSLPVPTVVIDTVGLGQDGKWFVFQVEDG